jgi:hypothetical protein
MKLLKIAALSAALLAGGCATELAWQRVDGRPLDSSFAWAAAHCRERARDAWGDRHEAMLRCMERHGYVWTYAEAPRRDRYRGDRYYNDDYDD